MEKNLWANMILSLNIEVNFHSYIGPLAYAFKQYMFSHSSHFEADFQT